MDMGQSENIYSKNSSNKDTGSTGLFKIGDYDNTKKKDSEQEGGLLDQATNTVMNQAQVVTDKLTGNTDTNKKQ
ncbi:hypothetical protein BD770DRAFT_390770 [Pilaira anomala]|nr:hypothetical protein BD770DRAFT_390770 [Pilaira anomala]